MTGLADQVAADEARRRRYAQVKQSTSPQMGMSLAALARENPSLSPGALYALAAGGVPAGSAAAKAAAQADVKVKQESGNIFQRALSAGYKGIKVAGGAVLPDFVGEGVRATLGNSFVKGVSRGADIGLSSIGQTVQGTFREAVKDGFSLGDVGRGFAQTDLAAGHREVQREGGYLGLLTGDTDVNYGSGYFAGGDVASDAVQRRRASSPLINGKAVTIGRYSANAIGLEPGGEAFSIVSGLADLVVSLGTDPTSYTGAPLRKLADKRLLAGPASPGFDAAAAGARVDAGLVAARAEQFGNDPDLVARDMGAIPGVRSTVSSDRVLEWLTAKKEGQQLVSYLADETDFGKLYDATKGKLPPDLLVKLAERQMTGDEVIGMLGPKLGVTARTEKKFSLDPVAQAEMGVAGLGTLATAKFKKRVRDTRIWGTVPERVLPKNDVNETLKNADSFMRNALIKKDDAFEIDGEMLSRGEILRQFAAADGQEGMLDVAVKMMKLGTEKAVERGIIRDKARDLFRIYADNDQARRAWWQEQVANPDGSVYWRNRGFNATEGDLIDSAKPELGYRALPHLASEFLDGNIPLPDPRAIRAEMSKFSGILSNPAVKVSRMGMEKLSDNIFKPMVLLRPAYIARNQIDEQFRPAGAGLDSLMRNPVSYFQWLLTDQDGIGKMLSRGSGERFASRGATDAKGEVFDDTAVKIREAEQAVKRAKQAGDQGAFEEAEQALKAARSARSSITPFTDGVSQYERSITGGLGNWRNKAYRTANGMSSFYKNEPAYARAVGEGVHRIFNDPLASRLAQDLSPEAVAKIKQDFWRGGLQKFRTDLSKQDDRMAYLLDELGAERYVDDTIDYIKTFTGDSPVLLNAAWTGKVNGVPITKGDTLEVDQRALDEIDSLKAMDDFQGPDRVIGSNIIKGGGDEDGTYTRFVNWAFYQIADRPTRYLSKSPAFRQRYYKRMENLIGFMDEASATKVIEGAQQANLKAKDLKRMQAKRGTGNGKLTLDEADLVAKTDAMEYVAELFYSLHNRGQFFDVTRLLFPFGEAFLDSARKYAQLTASNPVLPYRLQQAVEGARAGDLNGDGEGFFYTDEQTGEEMFAFPGSGPLLNLLGQEGAGKFRAPVKNLNILGTSVIPGFGPAVQLTAGAILPNDDDFNAVREIISPYGDRNLEGGVLESFLPSWFNKIRTSGILGEQLQSPAQQRAFVQAQKDMMGYLASTGKYDLQSEAGIQNLQDDAKAKARGLFVIRGLAQSFAPSPPSPEFVAYDKDGVLLTQFKLAEEYRRIYTEQKEAGTPESTNRIFIETFGADAMLAAIPNTKAAKNKSPINPNRKALEFYQRNLAAAERFPSVFGMFSPDEADEDFDFVAYQQQINRGERVAVEPDEAVRMANQRVARMVVQNAKDVIGDKPNADQKRALRDLKAQLAEDFPGYSNSFSNDTPALLEDLKRAAKDPALSRTDAGKGLAIWLQARDAAEAGAQAKFGVGWTRADASRPIRDAMRALAEELSSDFPGFSNMYERALEREMVND